jgi:hypothetical protein
MGLAVSGLCLAFLRLLGAQEADVAQRGNAAASVLLVGMCAASALAFAGANIGEGPGFHVVLLCAGLSVGTLCVFLLIHAGLGRSIYRVLVERDMALAVRLAGALIAVGLIAGRSVAGTWISTASTLDDFARHVWPVGLVLAVELLIAAFRAARTGPANRLNGILLGVLYVAGAALYLCSLGMPK